MTQAPGPMPRMSDSQAGPGAPSSLKFASLSVQSYQLDSPPFTGAAVGAAGPVDQSHRDSTSTASSSRTKNDTSSSSPLCTSDDRDPYTRSMSQSRSPQPAQSSPSSSASHHNLSQGDQDIPPWQLDSSQSSSRAHSSASLATLSPSKTGLGFSQTPHSHPPPPLSMRNGSEERPSYSQIAEVQEEDAGSSATDMDEEVDGDQTPAKVPRQGQTLEDYQFPRHRLPTKMRDETRTPLVIVACGSFSPPTYLHLRIFEMAKDQVNESGRYELMAGYYSPVSDYYKKGGLAKATHRVRMCELAVEKTSTWLMVDAWESLQNEYQRTAVVLDHFNEEINGGSTGGIQLSDGTRRKVKIMLLAGGDLIQSMGEPGVWATADLHHILGQYGCLIVERTGADVWSFLLSHDLLWKFRRNLKIVKQTIYNDISSSKVRLFVRRGQSIKYLLPNSVIQYIEKQGLYHSPPDEHAKAYDTNW